LTLEPPNRVGRVQIKTFVATVDWAPELSPVVKYVPRFLMVIIEVCYN